MTSPVGMTDRMIITTRINFSSHRGQDWIEEEFWGVVMDLIFDEFTFDTPGG